MVKKMENGSQPKDEEFLAKMSKRCLTQKSAKQDIVQLIKEHRGDRKLIAKKTS